MMIQIIGQSVAGGKATGKLLFYKGISHKQNNEDKANAKTETERFFHARDMAVSSFNDYARKCLDEVGTAEAEIFESYILLAKDEGFTNVVLDNINTNSLNVENALEAAKKYYREVFSTMESEYISARFDDICAICDQILEALGGVYGAFFSIEEPAVIAADDLRPYDILQLEKDKVLGIVLRSGTVYGHSAILARSLGIPVVFKLGEKLSDSLNGKYVFLDGDTATATITDTEKEATDYKAFAEDSCENDSNSACNILNIIKTKGANKAPSIYCNISTPDDLQDVISSEAQGIGLFRTEYLFLTANRIPSEEEQFQAYKDVIKGMNGKKVRIRTLDIGADKQLPYLEFNKEKNPALGVRGVRLYFERPDIFVTQLRAIYRASAYGNVSIIFPMITSEWEVIKCIKMCNDVKESLSKEGIDYNPNVDIGIMIETPAAVMITDTLAKHVDFFSIGTNDLTQYTLACDRENSTVQSYYDITHEAVLKQIKMAIDVAHSNGIKAELCGELGTNRKFIEALISYGVDEISVNTFDIQTW